MGPTPHVAAGAEPRHEVLMLFVVSLFVWFAMSVPVPLMLARCIAGGAWDTDVRFGEHGVARNH